MGVESLTLLLDTHILLWWLDERPRLSRAQESAISSAQSSGETLGLAAVTLWEVARLVASHRVTFSDPIELVLDGIERNPVINVLPLTADVAVDSTRLSHLMSNDPADRLIVATARVHGLRLVTADDRIRKSGDVAVV